MSCIITDTVVGGAASPFKGATVVAMATVQPLFQKVGGTFVVNANPTYYALTDANGVWTLTLPWPSECDPTTVEWQITTPDGYTWVGAIPEGIAGPLSIHALKQTYGWGLVYQPRETVTAVQGPGATLSNSAAIALAAAGAAGSSTNVARADHVHPTLPLATINAAGFLAAPDKKRIDGITKDFVADFGADPTGVTPSDLAWLTAQAFFLALTPIGGKLKIPTGHFTFNSNADVLSPMVIEGAGGGLVPQTKFTFAAGKSLRVHSPGSGSLIQSGARSDWSSLREFAIFGTIPPKWQASHAYSVGDVVTNVKREGEFTQLVYICTVAGTSGVSEPAWVARNEVHGWNTEGQTFVDGGVTWKATSSPGVWMKGQAFVRNVYVEGVPGDAFYVYGYVVGDPTGESACSGFQIDSCQAQLCLGRGLYVEGTDAQGGHVSSLVAQNCGSGGIYDNGDVGNAYIACLAETNGIGVWGASSGGPPSVGIVYPTFAKSNGFYYTTTDTTGTTGVTEPTWPTTIGSTVVDGTVTWTCAGVYTYGQPFKVRRGGDNGSVFIACYEEPDQRPSEIDHPAVWVGSIGGLFDATSTVQQFKSRNNSPVEVRTRGASPDVRAVLGTSDLADPTALVFSKIDGSHGYKLTLGPTGLGGNAWLFNHSAGVLKFWFTNEDSPEGPGYPVFFGGLHLGNGFGQARGAMRLNCISPSNGQVLDTAGQQGDFVFNRDAGPGQPFGWVCTTSGPGAVWRPMKDSNVALFDNADFVAAAATALTPANYTLGQAFTALEALSVIGIKFFWNDAAPVTIDCTLYDMSGTVLATKSVTTSGAGVYTAIFNTPVAMAAYAQAWATFHESTGTTMQLGAVSDFAPGGNTGIPYVNGKAVFHRVGYGAGAAVPTTDSPNVRYAVGPVIA